MNGISIAPSGVTIAAVALTWLGDVMQTLTKALQAMLRDGCFGSVGFQLLEITQNEFHEENI